MPHEIRELAFDHAIMLIVSPAKQCYGMLGYEPLNTCDIFCCERGDGTNERWFFYVFLAFEEWGVALQLVSWGLLLL